MNKTKVKTKEEARQKAIDYQDWVSKQNLSYLEISDWSCYFEYLGKEFDLTEEFRENGII